MSRDGLAWIGGAGLALGGALLVGYMAQQGWFTPAVRLLAAVLLGLGLLGFSEAVRRRQPSTEQARPPVAALAAGAGAAVLYATIWAAHGLYQFIDTPAAAVLLAGVSALLLALSFVHGQALAGLAIGAGYAAPAVTGLSLWGEAPLLLYTLAVLSGGVAASRARRWTATLILAVVGALAWSVTGVQDGSTLLTVGLALFTSLAAVALMLETGKADERWRAATTQTAQSVLLAAAVILTGAAARSDGSNLPSAALLALVALVALALSRRRLDPIAFASVIVLAGATAAVRVIGPIDGGLPWAGLTMVTVVVATLAAVRRLEARTAVTGAAAATAALLAALVSLLHPGAAPWLWPAAGALLLGGAAAFAAKGRGETSDVNLWAAAAGASLLVASIRAANVFGAPLWLAAASLLLAAGHLRLGWRSLSLMTGVGSALVLAATLSPVDATARWIEAPLRTAGFAAATAMVLWFSARVLARRNLVRTTVEAVETAAIGAALVATVVLLTWATPVGAATPLDGLTRSAMYTLLLLGTGYAGLVGEGASSGVIARLRSRGLLMAGVILGAACGAAFNPWTGVPRSAVLGAPLLDSLALAYLAPGLLAGLAAARFYGLQHRWAARLAAAASAGFLVGWVLLETRRLFDGPDFASTGAVGFFEGAVYALIALASPMVFAALRKLSRRTPSLPTGDLDRAARASGWAGLALAAWLMTVGFNPWWGPVAQPFASTAAVLTMLLAYAGAVGLSFAPARAVASPGLRGAGLASAVLHAFVGLTLAIRAGYRGVDLRWSAAEAPLETWTFSAAWCLFGIAVLTVGARRAEPVLRWSGLTVVALTVVKVLVFDLAALDGVVRAASFLAVGALMLGGALLVRRRAPPAGS